MAEHVLTSDKGRDAKQHWDQAQREHDIQEYLNSITPALLLGLHGREPGSSRSRPTYYDTHGGQSFQTCLCCQE